MCDNEFVPKLKRQKAVFFVTAPSCATDDEPELSVPELINKLFKELEAQEDEDAVDKHESINSKNKE